MDVLENSTYDSSFDVICLYAQRNLFSQDNRDCFPHFDAAQYLHKKSKCLFIGRRLPVDNQAVTRQSSDEPDNSVTRQRIYYFC